MFDISGITNLNLAWNITASKHGSSQCSIIKADAGFGGKRLIHIRQISGFYRLCFVIIIREIINYIIINLLQCIYIGGIF